MGETISETEPSTIKDPGSYSWARAVDDVVTAAENSRRGRCPGEAWIDAMDRAASAAATRLASDPAARVRCGNELHGAAMRVIGARAHAAAKR